ncbi:UNVERIFIED_CONTAM: hypothetical protein Sradi_4851500 [Sesamum radiatum]|uniref:Uncharacterized protein n=1 Tax=Sesamum radiatum TaxID=300843 RepID=A0AAW2N142_SESRA
MPPTIVAGGFTPATLVSIPPPLIVIGLTVDPQRRNTSLDTCTEEWSPALLGAIQQIVSAAIWEQVAALAPTHVATL